MSMKKIVLVMMLIASVMFVTVPSVSAVACTDAGDFSTLCTLFTNLSNLALAVITVVFTGANATTVIYATVVLGFVVAVIDLMRGNDSWIGRRIRRI